MSHIFISHARKGIEFAQKVADALVANNLDTWIDWKNILESKNLEQEIYHDIEGAI